MRDGLVFNTSLKRISSCALLCLFTVVSVEAAMQDPTRPPSVKASSYVASKKQRGPRWVLTSTLISADRRTAVINDKVVARGDRINGARVVSIQPSAVRLRVSGRDITLMMLKKNVKSVSRVAASGHH
jgi:MSHA biogenesis protein MshK